MNARSRQVLVLTLATLFLLTFIPQEASAFPYRIEGYLNDGGGNPIIKAEIEKRIASGNKKEKCTKTDATDHINLLPFLSRRYGNVPKRNICEAVHILKPLIFEIGFKIIKVNRYSNMIPVIFPLVLSRRYQIFLE